MSIFSELKRRNVFRVALFYVVTAWLIIEVAETVLPLFDVPDGVLRGLVVLLVIGLVPALGLSWIYEITPEGIKRDAGVLAYWQAHRFPPMCRPVGAEDFACD
jgi:hypothetical protein